MAFQIYLKLDGVAGESADTRHQDEIELLGLELGAAQSGQRSFGTGAGAGKTTFKDLVLRKRVDRASPRLALLAFNGARVRDAILTVSRAGEPPFEFYGIKLANCAVSSFDQRWDAQEGEIEEVTLAFQSIQIEYARQQPNGARGETCQRRLGLGAQSRDLRRRRRALP